MKSGTFLTTAAGLIVAGGIAIAFLRDAAPPQRAAAADPGVVHVDDLAEHPERYEDPITVRAVVAGVNKGKRVFGVIDAREFEECGVVTCAKYTVPVRFEGEIPEPNTVVLLTGRTSQRNEGLVFEAERVERIP